MENKKPVFIKEEDLIKSHGRGAGQIIFGGMVLALFLIYFVRRHDLITQFTNVLRELMRPFTG